MFRRRQWAIYILDDYSVHVTDEVRRQLLDRGYILICIGGGVTGDVQVNDTHVHHPLKLAYRKQESDLMADQLRQDPNKVPAPSRDDMMRMLVESWDSLDLNINMALKENFITNALDGSEDILVRDKLFQLVGDEIVAFRTEQMGKEPPNTLAELLATITPPEGVRRATQHVVPDEGYELLDADDGELEFQLDYEDHDSDEEGNLEGAPDAASSSASAVAPADAAATPVSSSTMVVSGQVGLPTDTEDESLNQDAIFLNELGKLLATHGMTTSTLMMPHLCHMRSAYSKARNSLKKRLKSDTSLYKSLVAVAGPASELNSERYLLHLCLASDMAFGQYWDRLLLVVWWHQAITWPNVDPILWPSNLDHNQN